MLYADPARARHSGEDPKGTLGRIPATAPRSCGEGLTSQTPGNLSNAIRACLVGPGCVGLTLRDPMTALRLRNDRAEHRLAAIRYLTRYIEEAKPSLRDVAGVAALLAERVAH